MVNRRVTESSSNVPPELTNLFRLALLGLLLGGCLLGVAAWFFPVEVVQSWVLERTSGDDYRKFEAIGRAEAACWLVRFSAPVAALVALVLLRKLSVIVQFFYSAWSSWIRVTNVDPDNARWSLRTMSLRGCFLIWGVISLGHLGYATSDVLTNWPYYRWKSGLEVLPNISDSNRAVIRYLLAATEPGSKIFIASDQKLYFLSYYLLPRRLYYQSHPDSEFVIPQPNLQRRMAAYTLSETDPHVIERIAPDYILEYFEQPEFVEQDRILDDQNWLSFYRASRKDPQAVPSYLVRLRRVEKGRRS